MGGQNPCTGGVRLLLKNKQLSLVVCANGLLQASNAIIQTFALAPLYAEVWGKNMSERMAASMICFSIVAMTVSGPFGRFSDQIDRRVACAIHGCLSFLPTWIMIPFLIFGMRDVALWASIVAKVLGAFTVSTNVLLALVHDVTDADDRDQAVGIYFAVSNLMMLVLNGVPVLLIIVLGIFPSNELTSFVIQIVLSVLYFVCIFAVRTTVPEASPSTAPSGALTAPPSVAPSAETTSSSAASVDRTSIRALLVQPIRLAFSHRRLRRVCLASFLLSFSGDLIMDIGGQFFNTALNLLPYGSRVEFQEVAVLTMIPGALLVIPGYMITGYLAKMGGTLKLLRKLIPFTAVMTCTGAILAIVPVAARWYIVPLVVVAQNYASLVNVPLLRLAGGVAPPGRVGEALAAVGVAGQTANLVGNAAVVVINPLLFGTLMTNPFWVYYPACALLSLSALIPVLRSPKGGWGAASGQVSDIVYATTLAHVAAQRWRQKAQPDAMAEEGRHVRFPWGEGGAALASGGTDFSDQGSNGSNSGSVVNDAGDTEVVEV
mmetsp:Transcript_57372/g.147527  ORF Transcript_57372/g.147527 Transcript_57372/m.147527 type:complete len:546 (-) Transcript_57372:920-2557(-)